LVRSAIAWTLRPDRTAAYDSFYLALAGEPGCDLWTADWRLARAAGRPG
jgi:predicted nucleic acid-binding protein